MPPANVALPDTPRLLPRTVAPTAWKVLEPEIDPVATSDDTDPVPAKVTEPETFKYPEVSIPVEEYWRAEPETASTPVRFEPSP
jgi:hypothetical protein